MSAVELNIPEKNVILRALTNDARDTFCLWHLCISKSSKKSIDEWIDELKSAKLQDNDFTSLKLSKDVGCFLQKISTT